MDTLRPGLLGRTRETFAARYCSRRLVRVLQRTSSPDHKRWDNAGVSHASELHALLAQVLSQHINMTRVSCRVPLALMNVVQCGV